MRVADTGGGRPEHLAALALGGSAAAAVALAGLVGGWHVQHPWIVAFLAVAAAIAAMQGVEFAEGLHYDAADPVVVLAGILGGPLGGAVAGAASALTFAESWESRVGYAATRALQGTVAGSVALALGLGYGATWPALGTVAAAEAAGAAVIFGVTFALAAGHVVVFTTRIALTNLLDPALGTPLVAGLALTFAGNGTGALLLLLVPSLLAATVVRILRDRWAARHAESEARARRDPLTGAFNRRWFDEELERELSTGTNVGLVLLDLDHFKAVNDAHGHAAGDQVLVEAVRRLSARVRAGDGVARWGGEELAVLLRNVADGADLAQRAEELRASIGDEPFAVDDLQIVVTASAGGASLAGDPDSLVRAADAALYDAKRAGRNRARLAA